MDTPVAATDPRPTPLAPDPFDPWLDRVTRRLSMDRELQWEVRLELRSHLQDSIAELRNAGRSEAEARDEAVRALGDEAELAEQLWRANRRRVRFRAAAAWAVRLILPPAAVTLAVVLAVGGLTSWAILEAFTSRSGPSFPGGQWLLSRSENAVIEKSSPLVRGLFEQNTLTADAQTPRAKALLDRRRPRFTARRASRTSGLTPPTCSGGASTRCRTDEPRALCQLCRRRRPASDGLDRAFAQHRRVGQRRRTRSDRRVGTEPAGEAGRRRRRAGVQ
jgi:hypothetical protein